MNTNDGKSNKVEITGDASKVQIQQNVSNSSQNQVINTELNYEEASKVLMEILKYKPFFQEVYGENTEKINELLNGIKIAIEKKEQPSKIKQLFGAVKDISIKVASNVISNGIVALIMQSGI